MSIEIISRLSVSLTRGIGIWDDSSHRSFAMIRVSNSSRSGSTSTEQPNVSRVDAVPIQRSYLCAAEYRNYALQ